MNAAKSNVSRAADRRVPCRYAGENGCLTVGIRDFWQKYPSAVEACDLDQDNAEVIFWLWCPQVEAMDFRHYADQAILRPIMRASM